jgi:hypothetical protein
MLTLHEELYLRKRSVFSDIIFVEELAMSFPFFSGVIGGWAFRPRVGLDLV